jgi:Family of unknown function (DUF5519)
MPVHGAHEKITKAALNWEGVSAHPHRFGGTEFRIGRRELGHIHGDYLVDIPFPRKVRDEIVSAKLAKAHHILPESGWVSCYLEHEGDVHNAIELLQRSYRLALQQKYRAGTPDI